MLQKSGFRHGRHETVLWKRMIDNLSLDYFMTPWNISWVQLVACFGHAFPSYPLTSTYILLPSLAHPFRWKRHTKVVSPRLPRVGRAASLPWDTMALSWCMALELNGSDVRWIEFKTLRNSKRSIVVEHPAAPAGSKWIPALSSDRASGTVTIPQKMHWFQWRPSSCKGTATQLLKKSVFF